MERKRGAKISGSGHVFVSILTMNKQAMPAGRQGFTIVELVVVIAIFGILAVISTNFLISMIKNGNQTSVQNEVRQNAARIMDDLSSAIRNGGCVDYVLSASPVLQSVTVYPGSNCSGIVGTIKYEVDATGQMSKTIDNVSAGTLNSNKVSICSNPGCGGGSCTPGLVISPSGQSTRAVQVKLTVQQSIGNAARSDFCASAILENTVTPRNAQN